MRNLSDTIARLRRLPLALPHGFPTSERLRLLGCFGSNPGQLKAWIYAPERAVSGAPLVVVLHGCTQNAAGYDESAGWSRLAEKHGFVLLYPEQQRSNNPNLCFNWFHRRMRLAVRARPCRSDKWWLPFRPNTEQILIGCSLRACRLGARWPQPCSRPIRTSSPAVR